MSADINLNLGGNADFIRPKYNKWVMLGAFLFAPVNSTIKNERITKNES